MRIILDNQAAFEVVNFNEVRVYISNIIVFDIFVKICKNICNNIYDYTKNLIVY